MRLLLSKIQARRASVALYIVVVCEILDKQILKTCEAHGRGYYTNLHTHVRRETSSSRLPSFLAGNFRLDHRHGAEHVTPEDDTVINDRTIVEQLAVILAQDISSPSDKGINEEEGLNVVVGSKTDTVKEAQLWKQLGKIRLDAGEYGEASRIFRRGAERCRDDEGLCHHVKVFEAFHGNESGTNTITTDKEGEALLIPSPPPLQLGQTNSAKDLFLSLDVQPDHVPKSILEMAAKKKRDKGESLDGVSPHRLIHLLHASKEPILTRTACQYIIQCAKEAVKNRDGGWTTDRHVHAPTCDIPVFELDQNAVQWIRDAMKDVFFPLIAKSFPSDIGVEADKLRIQDLFVVRYDGSDDVVEDQEAKPGFASLRPHEDESIISLTIALNDMSDYEGGGLFIASTGDLLNGDAGTVMAFAGGLVHGGYPVTKGTRWILTVFLYVDENVSGKSNGYTLDSIESIAHGAGDAM